MDHPLTSHSVMVAREVVALRGSGSNPDVDDLVSLSPVVGELASKACGRLPL